MRNEYVNKNCNDALSSVNCQAAQFYPEVVAGVRVTYMLEKGLSRGGGQEGLSFPVTEVEID